MPHEAISLPSDADASGRSFGAEELALLEEAVRSGTLNCTKGTLVTRFEQGFREMVGASFCRATTSGTAAVHSAIAAIDPEPGDEIITTPITDMGAITPILYQTAIPVFADVDPLTYNVTARTIEKKITRRTKAVIVTHLFGNCCDMDPILELCRHHGLPVIEDVAQAYLASYKGRLAGTMGAIGCFSLQQGKHMTTGEGGMVVTSDETLARRMKLFIDKAWGYGEPRPDHYFLALCYRMTELQGAVAVAQLQKLPGMVEHRVRMAEVLTERIAGVPGISAPVVTPQSRHVYWRYPIRVDAKVIAGGAVRFGAALKEAGIFCAPRYIQKPAFECEVLRDQRTFGQSRFPFVGEHRRNEPEVVYHRADTPGAIEALEGVVLLPLNEKYQEEHIEHVAAVIRRAAGEIVGRQI